MKFIIAFAALVAVAAAATQSLSPEAQAETIKLNVDNSPNGEYVLGLQTSNNINIDDAGKLKSVPNPENNNQPQDVIVVTGKYSYISPEGQNIEVTYTADETGFHPQGAHLPVAPAV